MYSYKYKYKYLLFLYPGVLILSSGGGCCGGFDHLFPAAGVVARRGHPLQPGQFKSSLPIKHQSCSSRYSLAPKTILSLPPPVLPDPLIRYTLPQNQATRFIDCTIETRVISPSAVQMQVKARDSQRDHWDLPDSARQPRRLRLSALDDHVAKRVSMRKGAADRCWSVHLQHRQNKPRSSD